MEQRLSIVTLGVRDLGRAREFYAKLGWGEVEPRQEGIAFFQLNGFILALYSLDGLAEDACVPAPSAGSGFGGVTLALNMRSPEEVDRVFREVLAHGARALKQPQPAFWGGYSGYFADPEGHVWEVAHNPHCEIDSEGRTAFRAATGG